MSAVEETPSEGAPEWMVSYADMITIMMAFFVVMYAMAGAKDPKKQQPVMNSLHKQFGKYTAGPSGAKVPRSSVFAGIGDGHTLRGGEGPVKKKGQPGDALRVTTIRQGDQATMGGVLWFDDGSATLNEKQLKELEGAAEGLNGKPQRIEIRGYTSPRPLAADSQYRDNWDLAYARCHATMKQLVARGIDMQRIRVSVAAHQEALDAPVDVGTPNGGRVEVFMLNEFIESTPESKPAKSGTTSKELRTEA